MAKTQQNPTDIDIVIETPKGSRNKFKWDPKTRQFKLGSVLPAGAVFPFDFGYVPDTKGDDGDPLDVLVLMDAPAFTGCGVEVRLVGVIEAEQTEQDGASERNDRLIAIACESHTHRDIDDIADISPNLLDEIEYFFASYNRMRDKEFRPLGRGGPEDALKLLKAARRKPKKRASGKGKPTRKKRT